MQKGRCPEGGVGKGAQLARVPGTRGRALHDRLPQMWALRADEDARVGGEHM